MSAPVVDKHVNAGYGWLPDRPDHRDLTYGLTRAKRIPKVDTRPDDVPRYDQLQIGSCTANAINGMYRFVLKKQGKPDADFSRLFLYYNERAMEGTVGSDSGAFIRDGLKSINHQGVCLERTWPYDTRRFTEAPPQEAYLEALQHEAIKYLRVSRTLTGFRSCLQAGYQFVFGFSVYEAFEGDEVARTGMLSYPAPNEKQLGGHAIRCVGYDDNLSGGSLIIANSWGDGWGDHGYFYMPYKYALDANLTDDFWTIREVEG